MPWSFWAAYLAKVGFVALALAAVYTVGRRIRELRLTSSTGRRVAVIEATMLSAHATVYLLRAGRRYFLVGSGSGGVFKLAELSAGELDVTR